MNAPKGSQLLFGDTIGTLKVVKSDLALLQRLRLGLKNLRRPFILHCFKKGVDLFLTEYIRHLYDPIMSRILVMTRLCT